MVAKSDSWTLQRVRAAALTALVERPADVEVFRAAMRMSGLLVVILIAFLISLAAAWWLMKPGKYAAPPPGYIGPGAPPDAGTSTVR